MDVILCYHCGFKDPLMEEVLQHQIIHHADLEVKIKQYILDAEAGTFTLQTKGYRVNPNECKKNGWILNHDKMVGTIRIVPEANVSVSSPHLKKIKSVSDHENTSARRNLDFEKSTEQNKSTMNKDDITEEERDFLEDTVPLALQTMKEAGFSYEFQLFHRLLADKKFPLSNILFLIFMDFIKKINTTTGAEFRYRDPVKRFYKAGYYLFHSRWLRFMHGIGGSKINFPVPDKRSFHPLTLLQT